MRIKDIVKALPNHNMPSLTINGENSYENDEDKNATLTQLTALLKRQMLINHLRIENVSLEEAVAISAAMKDLPLVSLHLIETSPMATRILLDNFHLNATSSEKSLTLEKLDASAIAQIDSIALQILKYNLKLKLVKVSNEGLKDLVRVFKSYQITEKNVKVEFDSEEDKSMFERIFNSDQPMIGANTNPVNDAASKKRMGSSDQLPSAPVEEGKKGLNAYPQEFDIFSKVIKGLIVAFADFKLNVKLTPNKADFDIQFKFPIPKGWNKEALIKKINKECHMKMFHNKRPTDEPQNEIWFTKETLKNLNNALGRYVDIYNQQRGQEKSVSSSSSAASSSSSDTSKNKALRSSLIQESPSGMKAKCKHGANTEELPARRPSSASAAKSDNRAIVPFNASAFFRESHSPATLKSTSLASGTDTAAPKPLVSSSPQSFFATTSSAAAPAVSSSAAALSTPDQRGRSESPAIQSVVTSSSKIQDLIGKYKKLSEENNQVEEEIKNGNNILETTYASRLQAAIAQAEQRKLELSARAAKLEAQRAAINSADFETLMDIDLESIRMSLQ